MRKLYDHPLDQLADKFLVGDGCWEWTAARTEQGYGRVSIDGRQYKAHRVIYELMVGLIPDGLQLDHLCRVPACVRPDHLEPVTNQENGRRGVISRGIAEHLQPHGTNPRYRSGCRCQPCTQVGSAYSAKYRKVKP